MIPGRMKRRVTIQQYVSVQSPTTGAVTKQWKDKATVWAEIAGISGRELIAAQAEQSETTIRIWIRYRREVTSQDRVVYTEPGTAASIYDIQAVLPDANRTRIELLCKGGLNNG